MVCGLIDYLKVFGKGKFVIGNDLIQYKESSYEFDMDTHTKSKACYNLKCEIVHNNKSIFKPDTNSTCHDLDP